jgi:hypothetical protein
MIKRIFSIAALSMMVAACGGDAGDDAEVSADSTSVTTMPGTDTVPTTTVVPTTDSVVTNTTVTTDTDTVQGQATTDSAAHP